MNFKISTSVLRYGVNDIQTHLNAAVGVVRARIGQSGHTVVAVAQDFDSQTMIILLFEHEHHLNLKLIVG